MTVAQVFTAYLQWQSKVNEYTWQIPGPGPATERWAALLKDAKAQAKKYADMLKACDKELT